MRTLFPYTTLFRSVTTALRLCDRADIVIEGFRPGVMERLGLGPEVLLARRPSLVYGRMTGWGQDGPIAPRAGHDINYIALSGALHAIGSASSGPVPPLNLVGDFGGGALYLAMGTLAAYIEAARSGRGQVVDAAMVEGAASLLTAAYGQLAAGTFVERRQSNRLDGGSHHYATYETADGEHIAIGANEPQFYARLLEAIGLGDETLPAQTDRAAWPALQRRFAEVFKTKTRAEWTRRLQDLDVCFAPVLRMSEAMRHPHNVARGSFVDVDGVAQPGPVPRFSATPSAVERGPACAGEHTLEVLRDWGFDTHELDALVQCGAVKQRA